MNRLPVELLRQICILLDDKKDLSSFSLIHPTCYEIAAPLLYGTIHLKFTDGGSLREAASELAADCRGRHFLKYARKLVLICLLKVDLVTERQKYLYSIKNWGPQFVHYRAPATRDTFLEHHLKDAANTCVPDLKIPTHHINSLPPEDEDWDPVTSLISRLHHLQELDFVLEENSFPSALLKAISQYHPDCLVNIWPCQGVEYSAPGISYTKYPSTAALGFDYETLNLQGLKTLGVEITMVYGRQADLASQPCIDEMLPFIFMPPNLRNLILQSAPYGSLRDRSANNIVNQIWAEFATTVNPMPACSLDSISLFGRLNIIPKLATIVDLSRLRSLEIQVLEDPAVLEQAAWVLPNLERLFLSVWQVVQDRDSGRDNDDLVAAIRAFRPLKYLSLCGFYSTSTLKRITEAHGRTLQGLILTPDAQDRFIGLVEIVEYKYPELTDSEIIQLGQDCPNLHELRLPIRRSAGGPQECNIYRALGQFPNLRTLIVDLHFNAEFQLGRPLELSHVRTSFINAATDEKLASDIWSLIASKQNTRGLQNLRIVPFGSESGHFQHIEKPLLTCFARSFLVTRYNLHTSGVPAIEEIGRIEWELWREEMAQICEFRVPDELERVLQWIWPNGPGEGGWCAGMPSFPLHMDGLTFT
ncbi:hypothetical protein BJY01DRAFT_248447 [Aspergillus pseudoustus]|uniref:F-box domain-containing protein n=1 Tax=Aspergillus pseudoustus TaxID=1810923 RepID=A0ABR4JV08_9EURO